MSSKIEIELDDDILELFTKAQKKLKEDSNIDLTLADCLNEGINKMYMLSHLPEYLDTGLIFQPVESSEDDKENN